VCFGSKSRAVLKAASHSVHHPLDLVENVTEWIVAVVSIHVNLYGSVHQKVSVPASFVETDIINYSERDGRF